MSAKCPGSRRGRSSPRCLGSRASPFRPTRKLFKTNRKPVVPGGLYNGKPLAGWDLAASAPVDYRAGGQPQRLRAGRQAAEFADQGVSVEFFHGCPYYMEGGGNGVHILRQLSTRLLAIRMTGRKSLSALTGPLPTARII